MDRHKSYSWLNPEKDFISQLASRLKFLQFKQWNRWNLRHTSKSNPLSLQRCIGPQQWKTLCKPRVPVKNTKETVNEKAARHGFESNVAFQEEKKHNIPMIQMRITIKNDDELKNTFNLKAEIASKFALELEKTLTSMAALKSDEMLYQENVSKLGATTCMQEHFQTEKSLHFKNTLNAYQDVRNRSSSKLEESSGSIITSFNKGPLRKESTFISNNRMDIRKTEECQPEPYHKSMLESNNTEGAGAEYDGKILTGDKTSISGKTVVSGIALIKDKIIDEGEIMSDEKTEFVGKPNPERCKIKGGGIPCKGKLRTTLGGKTELGNRCKLGCSTECRDKTVVASTSTPRSKRTSNIKHNDKALLESVIVFGSKIKTSVVSSTTSLDKTKHCTKSLVGRKSTPSSKNIEKGKTTAAGITTSFASKSVLESKSAFGNKTRVGSTSDPGRKSTGRNESVFGDTPEGRENRIKFKVKNVTGSKATTKCKSTDKHKASAVGYTPAESFKTVIRSTPISKISFEHRDTSRDRYISRDKSPYSYKSISRGKSTSGGKSTSRGKSSSGGKSAARDETGLGGSFVPESKIVSKSKTTASSNDKARAKITAGNSACSSERTSVGYSIPASGKTNPKRNSVNPAIQTKLRNTVRKENNFQTNEKSTKNFSTEFITLINSSGLNVSDVHDIVRMENTFDRNDKPLNNTAMENAHPINISETLEAKGVSKNVRGDDILQRNDKTLKNVNTTYVTLAKSTDALEATGINTLPLPLKVNNKRDTPTDTSEALEVCNVNDVMNRLKPKDKYDSKLWLVHMKPLPDEYPYSHKYLLIPLVPCPPDNKSISEKTANLKSTNNYTSIKSIKRTLNSSVKSKVSIKSKKKVNFTSPTRIEIAPQLKQRNRSKLKYATQKMTGGRTTDTVEQMQADEGRNSQKQINKKKSQSSVKEDYVNNLKSKQQTSQVLRNFKKQTNDIKSENLVRSNITFRIENECAAEVSLGIKCISEGAPSQSKENFLKSEEVPNYISTTENAFDQREEELNWSFWEKKKNEDQIELQKIRNFLQSNTFRNSPFISEKVKTFLARNNSVSREEMYAPERKDKENISHHSTSLTEPDKPPEMISILRTSSQCSSMYAIKDNVSVKLKSSSMSEIAPQIKNSLDKIKNLSNPKQRVLWKENCNLRNALYERNAPQPRISGGRKKSLQLHIMSEPRIASQTKGKLELRSNFKSSEVQKPPGIEQVNKIIPGEKKEFKLKTILTGRFSHGPLQLQPKNLAKLEIVSNKKWNPSGSIVPNSTTNTIHFPCQRMTDLHYSMFDACHSVMTRGGFPQNFMIASDKLFQLDDIFAPRNTPRTLLTYEQMVTKREQKLAMQNNVLELVMMFDSLDSKNLFKSTKQFHKNNLRKTIVSADLKSETFKYGPEKRRQSIQSSFNLTHSYELVDKLEPKVSLRPPNFVRNKAILHRKAFSGPQITKTQKYLSKKNNIEEMNQILTPKNIQRRKTVSELKTINNLILTSEWENNFKVKNILEQCQHSKTCLEEKAQKQAITFKSNAWLKPKMDTNSSNVCKPLRKYGLLFEQPISSTLKPETEMKLNITPTTGNKFPHNFTARNKLLPHTLQRLNNLFQSASKLGQMNSFGANIMSKAERKFEPNINFSEIKEATAM
ncbi:uncharacterized protein LOC106875732 [Octopus bimaculoides]|uniref:uncharacterized protein LOC106875732 n=1 Tax=Octopus bimaculoides TaxID=37653 RepID=UPI00071E0C28|nr:uncharacterized protein LOC106875732 [Octopus bimaculoides]XP_014779465.1 uncharacterized protein LOC106875732 [Octopus bimaculoides]|eukprot:XP_014779464.1 PREDICTED: uncharacterized protein LOC106875732 [Octopus bimaculoides]